MNASDVKSVDLAGKNALMIALTSNNPNYVYVEGLRMSVVRFLISEVNSPSPYSAVITSGWSDTLVFLQELDASDANLKNEKTDFDGDGVEENALYWAQCSGADQSVIDYISVFYKK